MAYQPKSYRKFLATGVATAMVATAVAPAVSADEHVETSFTDVPEGSWYADNLGYVVERGIIEGYTDGTFRPDGQITRAEVAAVVKRAMDLDASATPNLEFTDTSDTQWYAAYVQAVVDAGYMQGDPGGTFRPNAPMSRGEFARVMVNAFDLELDENADISFSDLDAEDTTQWYYEDVMILASLGIVDGFTDGTFRAETNVNRAQATAFVHRTEVPEVRVEVPQKEEEEEEVAELAVESVGAINATTLAFEFNQDVDADTGLTFFIDEEEVDEDDVEYDDNYAHVTVELADGEEYELSVEDEDEEEIFSTEYTFDAEAYASAAVDALEALDPEVENYDAAVDFEEAVETARSFASAVNNVDNRVAFLERIDEHEEDYLDFIEDLMEDVNDANNQIDFFEVLDGFWEVDEDLIAEYWAEHTNFGTIHDVQDMIESVSMGATDSQIVSAIAEAANTNRVTVLRDAFEEYDQAFERVNTSNAHVQAYLNVLRPDVNSAGTSFSTYDTVEKIQEQIDLVNLQRANTAVNNVENGVSRSAWNSALSLVEALEDDHDEVGGLDNKETLEERLEAHDLIISVSEARTTSSLSTALEALEDHPDADADWSTTVYDALLNDYLTELNDLNANQKNTVLLLNNIVNNINESALKDVLDDIDEIESDEGSDLIELFEKLQDITPDLSDTNGFEMSIVKNDWADDYAAAFNQATGFTAAPAFDPSDANAVNSVVSVIEFVNGQSEVQARNDLQTLNAMSTLDVDSTGNQELVIGALRDLVLEDVNSDNAREYLVEIEQFTGDFEEFATTTGGTITATYVVSKDDIQEDIVDDANAVVAVHNASTTSQMRTALAYFGSPKYVDLGSARQGDVSNYFLGYVQDFKDGESASAYDFGNADVIETNLEAAVVEVRDFLLGSTPTGFGEVNNASLTISSMRNLLLDTAARDYVLFPEFSELNSAQRNEVAEYVLENRPSVTDEDGDQVSTRNSNGYRTIAAVKTAIEEGIAELD